MILPKVTRRGTFAIPRLWPGETVHVLGGGPSLRILAPELDRLRDSRVVVVNKGFLLAPWADALYWNDCGFWAKQHHGMEHFEGFKFCTCNRPEGEGEGPRAMGVITIHRTMKNGLSTDQHTICWNGSSGGAAVNLATLLGAKRVVLYGFDMRAWAEEEMEERGMAHALRFNWHDHYGEPKQIKIKRPETTFKNFRLDLIWDEVKAAAKRQGIEILNATPGSALGAFPIVDPETVLPERRQA